MTANAWLQSGLTEVLLPSGYRVRLVLPDLRRLARRGILSTYLLDVALAASKADLADVPEDQRDQRVREYGDIIAREVCWAVRESASPDGEWLPTTLTPEMLDTLTGPDLEVIEKVITGVWTPARATRFSAALRGLQEQATDDEEEDLEGYATFRDERRSGVAAADSEPLPGPPERDAGDTGPTGGVRAGRGVDSTPRADAQGGSGASGGRAADPEPAGTAAPEGDALRDRGGPRAVVTHGQ